MLVLMLLGTAAQSEVTAVPPLRSSNSEQIDRAAGAIVARDEVMMTSLIASEVTYDADFDAVRGIRGPERRFLGRVLKEVRGCNVNAVMRNQAVDASYGINWVCTYRAEGKDHVPHAGAHAWLRNVGGKPTLVNFQFQGPWPSPPRLVR